MSEPVQKCENKTMQFLSKTIDAVNQGNWSLSIKFRLECFAIIA